MADQIHEHVTDTAALLADFFPEGCVTSGGRSILVRLPQSQNGFVFVYRDTVNDSEVWSFAPELDSAWGPQLLEVSADAFAEEGEDATPKRLLRALLGVL